jgi:SNF family Na+-dependent transporter
MIPKEFFTVQSMATLTGAAGATFVVANGIQQAFNRNPRWLALLIAMVISVFGTYTSHRPDPTDWTDYFVAVVNGFLIFATAAGGTHIAGRRTAGRARGVEDLNAAAGPTEKRSFLTQWF